MDFKRADFINATRGGQFISDLMPKYPIYVNLLDERAQAVIGAPLEASKPAMQMLMDEGFRYQGYIDVFDAGPTMQAERGQIRTVRKSKRSMVSEIKKLANPKKIMVATTSLANFYMGLAYVEENKNSIAIEPEAAEAMRLEVGGTVRYIEA